MEVGDDGTIKSVLYPLDDAMGYLVDAREMLEVARQRSVDVEQISEADRKHMENLQARAHRLLDQVKATFDELEQQGVR